jgi:putative DNA primase/helicase
MNRSGFDFNSLKNELLSRSESLLRSWFPSGKLVGREFCVGSLNGEAGNSLKINTRTGQWSDFATGEAGGDLISLYAAIHGITQSDAARELLGNKKLVNLPTIRAVIPTTIGRPPEDAKPPSFVHKSLGSPSQVYEYKDSENRTAFFVARYNLAEGKKSLIPYSWDLVKKDWVNRAWKECLPLFNLQKILESKDATVIVVEGEKCVLAAESIFTNQNFVFCTWAGGAQAVKKTDFKPFRGRKIIIWPDADDVGVAAAKLVAHTAHLVEAESVEILKVDSQGFKEGFDVADAIDEGWDAAKIKEFIELNAFQYQKQSEEKIPVKKTKEASKPAFPKETLDIWKACGFSLSINKSGEISGIILNAENLSRAFYSWPDLKDRFWWDDFHKKIFFKSLDRGVIREFSFDHDLRSLLVYFQSVLRVSNTHKVVLEDALIAHAVDRKKNEPQEWVKSLQWDGVDRISGFFTLFCGADKNAYSEAVSRNFWVSIIARIFNPGCQVDNMVVLEGSQGVRKTSLLRAIGGPWYCSASAEIGTKPFWEQIIGRVVVEFSELEGMNRSETTSLKRDISTTVDRFRPSYGRSAGDFPRTCVFVGTTNKEDYLKDETGNRRFWPIRVEYINLESFIKERDQVFAEAYFRWKRGDSWWEMPEEETLHEQAQRMEVDPWESVVLKWVEFKDFFTMGQILGECLDIPRGQWNRSHRMRVGAILKLDGWKYGRNKERVRGYLKK